MTSYVEKIRVPVRIAQAGLPPVDGYLSLGLQAEFHAGPETLLERLNTPSRVVPFQRGADERTLLFNRSDIEWVAADPAVAPHLICPANYQVTGEEAASVRMMGGNTLEGHVQMELPEHLNRASDYMNGPEDFFPLLTPFGVLLVNKQRVSCLELHHASPAPPFTGEKASVTGTGADAA